MFSTSKYANVPLLKGIHLEKGTEVYVTVSDGGEHIFRSGVTRPYLCFKEIDQKLILNQKILHKMIELFGHNADDWIDCKIRLLRVEPTHNANPAIVIEAA